MTFCSATINLNSLKSPRAVAKEINPSVETLLLEKEKSSTYGVVIFDFPSSAAIQASIRLNPLGKHQFNPIPTGLWNDATNWGKGGVVY